MKVEVPEFKRCLCCIPLRYGLLFWGYIKLIASLILLGQLIWISILTTDKMQIVEATDDPDKKRISYLLRNVIIFIIALTPIVLLEISINIVFIVGGHKKSPKLMKLFYYNNIGMLCLYVFGFAVLTTMELMFQLPDIMTYSAILPVALYIKVKIGAGILYAAIQLYFILLTRSEVRKLQNHSTFRFNNIAAEAQCKMETDGHIEQQYDENSENITEVKIRDDNIEVIRNNNINSEKND